MKKLFIFLLTFPCLLARGQQDFERADNIAVTFSKPYTDAATLAAGLTVNLETEAEKARALFMWVAHNVRYDCHKYRNPPPNPRFAAPSQEELKEIIAEWEAKQLEKTMKSKRGVCGDYARLFHALCESAGLEAVIVTGNARDFHKPYRNAHDNPHAWNAVKVGGRWALFDPTWAAGYTNPEVTRFTRKLSPGFFMTPPAWFALDHFPDDEKWQLLDKPLDKKAFADQPLINYGQADYPIEGFSPQPEPAPGNDRMAQIRIKFTRKPEATALATGKGKDVKFTQTTEDGWQVFRFSPKGRDVMVYGGKPKGRRSTLGWLARYEVR